MPDYKPISVSVIGHKAVKKLSFELGVSMQSIFNFVLTDKNVLRLIKNRFEKAKK